MHMARAPAPSSELIMVGVMNLLWEEYVSVLRGARYRMGEGQRLVLLVYMYTHDNTIHTR